MSLFDEQLKKYKEEYLKKKEEEKLSGGGGGAGAFVPEPYQPINLDDYLKPPSTEEMNQAQDILLTFEKDYEAITLSIDTNYELYKEFTKQLDDLEVELEEAVDEMKPRLNQRYNEIREQHNVLVETLQKDTKRQQEIHQEYTEVRTTYDKDIEIYNRWAKAENEKEPEPTEAPKDEKDPTWGQVVYHSLRAGLSSANKNFWNIGRMLEMGKIKAEDTIDKLFFPGAKKREEEFKKKYGKDPSESWSLDVLTGLVEDAEAIEAESAPQAESKNWLKQSLNIGLRPLPQIAMSVGMGAAMPVATGIQAIRPTAEFMKGLTRMLPFGTMSGVGKSREIEKRYEELGEEAPYMKMLLAGAVTGTLEMASEMPVYFGVMNMLKRGAWSTLVNSGAKKFIDKFGFQLFTNMLWQGVQEGEMAIAGEAINKAFGEPDEWNIEGLTENTLRDFWGGICMGFVTMGVGGGISGSMAVAQKTEQAIDRFAKDKDDIRETLRKILEYQGIIMEEAEIETLAYEAKETPEEKKIKELETLMVKNEIFLEDIEKSLGRKIDPKKPVDIAIALNYIKKVIKPVEGKIEVPKVEPKAPEIFKGKAYRGESKIPEHGADVIAKMKTAKEKLEYDYGTTGNQMFKDAEKKAEEAGIDLSGVKKEDMFWVAKKKEIAQKYGEAFEVELPKDTIILAKDKEEGFLVLKDADKYMKVEPKAPGQKFIGEAYRAESGLLTKGKNAQEIVDFEAEELGNIDVKEKAEELAKKLGIELKNISERDVVWVADTLEKAQDYGKAEKVEITKDNIILAEDGDGGYLVLQNADKYTKVEVKVEPKEELKTEPKELELPSDRIRSEYIKKAEESTKKPTREELLEAEDLVIVRKEGEKYTYSEQWIENCWKALFAKPEYKGMKRADAIEKFVDERFQAIADKQNLKIDDWSYKQGRLTVEMTPKVKPLEERLKEALAEIKKLKGILKTVKGNVKKRAEFKKQLMEYIRKNMPYAIQNKMLATMKNVSGAKGLEKAIERIDEYTLSHYGKQYRKAIENELKAKKIKPKRSKSGMLKGRFTPTIQDKLDFIRGNINNSRGEALEKIQKLIQLANEGKAINVAEEIELLNMVGIKEMDLETLQSTLTIIKQLKKEGRTQRGIKEEKRKKENEKDVGKTLKSVTGKEAEIDEESGKIKIDSSYKTIPKTKEMGWIKKTIDKIVNWQFGWDNLLDKLSFMDKASKPYESELSQIGDKVHYARVNNMTNLENALTLIQMKFAEAFQAKSRKEITQITRKLREDIDLGEFKNSEGDTVHLVLNKEQILKKVMQLDDITLESRFEGMLYTEEIENAIRGAVSKKELAWIDGMKEIYEHMWGRINPIFEDMFGIHFPHITEYSGTARTEADINTPEATLLAQDVFKRASILNPSLKARSKSKQPLKYDEATSSLMNYVMQMEHFIAWAKPLQELRNIFGDKRVTSVISESYGRDVLTKINGFLDDITRDGVDKAKIIKWVDTIRFNFTRSILAKPHIGLKQIPSVLAYMTEMPVQDFFNGVGNFWKNPIKNYRYLVEHSAYARARFGEGFERDIHGAMQSDYVHLLSHTHKISDMSMGMVRAGDKFAVMQGMWAKFYSETKGQTTKAKNAEEAIRRAEISTQRTQPSFTIESLATGQRGGSFLKLFTMFQNQPNKYFRIIADNARNFRAGRGSRAKAASNIVLAWAVLPMLFQFIGDGGKWYTPHQLRALILGIFNDILVFGSMTRGLYGWLIKEAYDVQASPVFATLREIEYCLAKVAKWSNPDKDLTPEDIQAFTEHFAKGLGQLVGLPTPYGVQVTKAIQSGDYRQLLFSEYVLNLGKVGDKKKKPYVPSGDKYGKYLKSKYSKPSKYKKYLRP